MALEEISTFPPKKVHIVTFIGLFSTFFGKIALSFWSCQLVFGEVRSVERREEDGDRIFGFRRQLRLRGQYCQEKFESQVPWRVKKTD